MSSRTISQFTLVGLLMGAVAGPIAAQLPPRQLTTPTAQVPPPSPATTTKPMPDKLSGTWYRQFEGGVVTATFNDDELKMCATLNADGTLIHLTFTADYALTKDGLVHGAISGVDWDIKHPGVTEPKKPFPTPPDSIRPAEYPLVFKDGPKKGKEVVVALFVSSSPGIGPVFAGSEGKIASEIADKLPQMAKESNQKLTVLDPALVNRFKMKTPTWKTMHPSEWGKKLGVDFVLDIHLEKMSLYQPGSLNQLYEGRADVTGDVYDVDAGAGEPKYNYVQMFIYPYTDALDATTITVNRFKQDFLEHLAANLAMKHIDHKPWSGIVDEPPSETPPSLPIDLSDADVISAFHALVDCPFSFRTRSTSAGLMVSNIKLAADDDSFSKTARLFGGMYTFSKDGNIPTPKPAKTTTTYGGMTLPSGQYLDHCPQYYPPDPVAPLPREHRDRVNPEGANPAGETPNSAPTMPMPAIIEIPLLVYEGKDIELPAIPRISTPAPNDPSLEDKTTSCNRPGESTVVPFKTVFLPVKVSITGPLECQVGTEITFQVKLENSGQSAIQEVYLQAALSGGLHHIEGSVIEAMLSELKEGETKAVPLHVRANKAGTQECQILVLTKKGEITIARTSVKVVEQSPPGIAQTSATAWTIQTAAPPSTTAVPCTEAKPGITGTWYREFGSKLQVITIAPDHMTMTVMMSGEMEEGKTATANCTTTADYHISRDGMTIVGLITGVDAQVEGDLPEDTLKDISESIEKVRKDREDQPFAMSFRLYGDSLVIRNVRMPEGHMDTQHEDVLLQTNFGGSYKKLGDKQLPKPKVTKVSQATEAPEPSVRNVIVLPSTNPTRSVPVPPGTQPMPEPAAPVPTMPQPTPIR